MVARAKMLSGRRRVQHRFDLNLNKEDENQLDEMIRSLKKKRSFLGVIRDGIRLILDLRQGQTDVLRELFPWVLEQTYEISNENLLKSHFEELRLLLSQGPSVGVKPTSSSFNIAEVHTEDEGLEITQQAVSEDYNPAWTFAIKSATAVYGSYSGISSEMIWYGIRTGYINVQAALDSDMLTYRQVAEGVKAKKINKKKLPEAVMKEIEKLLGASGPKKIVGADIALSEPNFDDIEVDF